MTKPRSHNSPADSPEEGLKTVLDAAPVGMLAVDDREMLVYANIRAEQVFGRKLTAPGTIRCGDFISCSRRHTAPEGCGFTPDCPNCPLFQAIRSILASDPSPEVVADDLRLEREAPLDPIWITYKASPVTLGSRRHAILSVEDISERKRAEFALKENEKRFRDLYEQAPLGYQSMDADGRLIEVNPAWLDMLGYARSEVIGHRFEEFLASHEHAAFRRRFSQFLSIGQVHADVHMIRRDGSVISVHIDGCIGRDERGRFKQTHCILADVTARKRAEEALCSERDLIAHLMDTSPAGIVRLDADGRINYANKRAEKILGLGQAEMAGRTYNASHWKITDFGGAPVPDNALPFNRVKRAGKSVFAVRHAIERPDGKRVLLSVNAAPLMDSRSNFEGMVATLEDISAKVETEQKYEMLFREMFDGFALHEIIGDESGKPVDYRFLDVNPAFERLTGLKAADILGRTVMDVLPETEPYWIETYGRVAFSGKPAFFENYTKGLDRYFQVTAFRPAENQLACIFVDVTARRQAEVALRESEEKFRLTFHSSPDAININRLRDGRYVEINAGFTQLTGFTWEDVSGRTSLDIDIWYDPADRRRLVEGLQKTGGYDNLEARFRRKDGSLATALMSARVITLNGEPHIISITRDISERKKAEAERERLLLAIEQADEMVAITDAAGIIQYMNPAFERITGFTDEEAFGQTPRILKSGRHDENFYRELWSTILSGSPWKGRLINQRRDGGVYTAECSISPIKDEEGRVVQFVWISRDITNELELEKRIAQAQKMEAIGALAGGIAHDFNNLLFPILGLSEMLREDLPPNSPEGEQAGEIFQAARRASSLVKQILTFSRQTELEKTPIRIQTILKEILRLSRATIPSDIAIQSQIHQDCGPVMTSPTQIHQIAMNLVTNAYHAIEPNPGTIRIDLQEVALEEEPWPGSTLAQGRYVLLRIADTGCGIAPADMGRIFEPYFTTKAPGKGTGLGLAVVYGIVQENQGDIKVASTPGKGSSFEVFLPLVDRPFVEKAGKDAAPLPTGNERVLIVDDEVAVVRLQRRMLESLGYRVSIRTDSREGLNTFRREAHRFDLVITDMTMPAMTGDRLAMELLKVRPDVPIILCTGFSERITPEIAKSIGIKDLLMKPVAKAQLARTIRKVLDAARPSG